MTVKLIIRDRNLIIRDSSQSDCTQTFCKMSRTAQKNKGRRFRYCETVSTYQLQVFAHSSDLVDFKPLRTFRGSQRRWDDGSPRLQSWRRENMVLLNRKCGSTYQIEVFNDSETLKTFLYASFYRMSLSKIAIEGCSVEILTVFGKI